VIVVKQIPDFFGNFLDDWAISVHVVRCFFATIRNDGIRGKHLRGWGTDPSAEMPAASGLGEDRGWAVAVSRSVASANLRGHPATCGARATG
jgi:hypothetical protein